MKKIIKFISILFLLVGIYSTSLAQNINSLEQFTSTTTPSSAITQRTYGKSLRFTGLENCNTTSALTTNSLGLVVCGLVSGSGGGSGGGTMSTTSPYSGLILQFPYTSLVTSLDGSSTTTSGYYFDPINEKAQIGNVNTASTTLLGNIYFPTVSQGFSYIGTNGKINTISTSTLAGLVFPYTSFTGYNATSTVTAFLNGLFSTASSTFSGNLFLPSLSQGLLFTGSNGLTRTVATTTLGTSGSGISLSGTPVILGSSPLTISNTGVTSVIAGTGISVSGATGDVTISATGGSASSTLLSDTNYWAGRNVFTNATSTNFGLSNIYAIGSGGLDFHSNSGTPIADFGAGGGAGATFFGGVNIDGATRLATSLNGILKATSGSVGTATNGTDYTLIAGTTCSGTDKVSAVSASGVVTCSTDQTGGGSTAYEIATTSDIALSQIAYIAKTGGRTTLASTATTTASCSGSVSCSAFTILGSSPITITGSGGSGGGLGTTTPWTGGNIVTVFSDGNVTSISTTTLVNSIFPFTSDGISTSSVFRLNGGFIANASSTIMSPLRFPNLANGGLAVFGGLLSSGATTTAGTGLTYSGNAFNVNTSQNITQLTNLNTAGFVITDGSGNLSTDTNNYALDSRNITAGDGLVGGGDLSADRTIDLAVDSTLSVSANSVGLNLSNPNSWLALQTLTNGFLSTASSTIVGNATTTGGQNVGRLYGAGLTACNSTTEKLLWGADGLFTCGTDQSGSGGSGSSKWATSTDSVSIYPSGATRIGIGTTSPMAELSIVQDYQSSTTPAFTVSTSSPTSTTTAFSVSGKGKVAVGSGSEYPGLEQSSDFYVDGRSGYGDWSSRHCDNVQNPPVADGVIPECGWFYFEANTTSASSAQTAGGVRYNRIPLGASTQNNDGAGVLSAFDNTTLNDGYIQIATTSPVFEVVYRPHQTYNSTTTTHYIGLIFFDESSSSFPVEPTIFTAFVASSTKANWQAVSKEDGNYTIFDTGVASTTAIASGTSDFRKFRINCSERTRCDFFIQNFGENDNLVASITTNLPDDATDMMQVGMFSQKISIGGGQTGFDWYRGRYWWRTPFINR